MANRKIKAELDIEGKDNSGPAFRSVALRMGQVEKQIGKFNKQAAAFNRTAGEFGKRIQSFDRVSGAMEKRHTQIARVTEGMGVAAARYLGPAALAAGVVYATKQAGNFEESLVNIQKKASATTQQMSTMRSEIMDLGHQMPTSLDDISKAFERGAAAGIPLGDLKEFASLSLKVADAWDVSSEDAANFFAGFHASMGIDYGKKMKDYASLINDLADSGIADERDIGDFIDRSGAPLKNFGMTPEEIAGYGAAMLNLKMPAEVAARSMNTLSSALLAPENLSKKAHAGLAAIVGDVGQFSKLSGNQKMTVFLDKLHDMTSQRRASLLGALLGTGFSDEIARLVAGVDEVHRNLEMAHKETLNASNSVDQVYAKRMEIFNSQVKVLQNNMNELAVRFGDYVLPTANKVLGGVNGMMADADARSNATKGMSFNEMWQQRNQYIKQWKEQNPGRRDMEAVSAYNRDLARVGRGEIQDVSDPLRDRASQQRAYDTYMSHPEMSNANRRGSPEKEFPGGDHHYNPRNLPKSGVPVPFGRPAVVDGSGRSPASTLGNQYDQYHQGWQAMHDSQSRHPLGTRDPALVASNRATETMVGGAILEALVKLTGGDTKWPKVSNPGDHPAKDELPVKVDTEEFRQSAFEAGQKVADGGRQASDSIKDSADAIRVAGIAAGQAILDAVKALQGVSIRGGQPAAVGNTYGVNADRGQSMPPAVTAPGSGTGDGGGGGGGF